MQLGESIKIALNSMVQHKLRSSLTLLGVVIGVMTIIATMSVIKGLQDLMNNELMALSAGVFQVQRWDPGGFEEGPRRHEYRPKLGMAELRAIQRNAPSVQRVAAEIWRGMGVVRFQNEATNPNVSVCGGMPGTATNNSWTVAEGRELNDQDVQFARDICVLGHNIANRLFPFRSPLGEYVTVNGQRARVVGVFEQKGSMFNQYEDNLVLMPVTTFVDWYGSERSWIITVKARNPGKTQEAIDEVVAAVRAARGLQPGEENNFGIYSSEQMVDTFNQITKGIRIAAFGIASIALVVAGVGIMNIMLVTVTERTREIGIRKALGAKSRSILYQFLTEAIILTNIGGLIGVALGVSSALLLGSTVQFGGGSTLPISIPTWSIILGISFCTLIGLVFGTWPAWKAARLDPIEALRYE